MRLLELKDDGDLSLTVFSDNIPPYAILSHTWGADSDEVTYKDLEESTGKSKIGYDKIYFCGKQAARNGLRYFWVDTCCINKSDFTELNEAINSMFRWYHSAARCYVYLSDVHDQFMWESTFRQSRWFTRGWTLQELLAPSSVEFFSQEGNRIGDKRTLEQQIHKITGVAIPALRGASLSQFDVEERLSWSKTRRTKRKEDEAYCLLGIFDVYIPLIYGEGRDNAFTRLQEEINKRSKGLDRLPYAVEAPFNSYVKQHEPTCFPNTRVDLLRLIYSWADGQDERGIFWLNGLAGTGKSTISRTVARKWYSEGCLGASFFFSRGGGDVGHAGKFVTSVAVQLASSVPTIYRFICDAITDHSDISNWSLRDQWQLLVLDPLSKLDGKGCCASYILVVDALDECDDDNNIRIILQLLTKARSLKTVRLQVLLTSRPEVPIRYSLCQMPESEHRDFILHNVSPSIVDHDIYIFLEYDLRLIGQERSLDASWPGRQVISLLVQKASGLFIWAATACRFIRDGKQLAKSRLNKILQGNEFDRGPEQRLNEIYLTVLQNSFPQDCTEQEQEDLCDAQKEILGSIVALLSPLSADSLTTLLYMPEHQVDQTLQDLYAILDIPEDRTYPLRLLHPSFRDFLFDKDRCKDPRFWVDERQAHQKLADSCIRLMSTSLKQDIYSLSNLGVLVTDIKSSQVERGLPPEVQYACLYWIQHLQRSSAQLRDNDQVHHFLQEHLLHWFEALGWIGKVSEGIHAIASLESITMISKP